jgi:hypothetical protein
MSGFERAVRRRLGDLSVTGYRQVPQERSQAVAFTLAHVRSLGCNCNPEITLPAAPRSGEFVVADIAHDDWCELLGRMEGR